MVRGQYTISVQIYEGKAEIDHPANKEESEVYGMSKAEPHELAKVKYSTGLTLSIGNYQFARVDVGIELPAHINELDAKYDEAAEFCNDKLMGELDNINQLKKVFKK